MTSSRPLWIAVLVILAGVLGLVLAFPDAMLSPGKMLKGHQTLASDCFACHVPLRGSRPGKCANCHEVERIGRFTTTGKPLERTGVAFHQQLSDENCVACHSEHKGADAAPERFSHDLLETEVRGQCASCHAKPKDALHVKLENNCQSCHTTKAWQPASFDHAKYFLLDREHDVACATCHVDGDFSRYTCYGCHEHTPAGIRAEHLEEGIRRFDDCVECHRSPTEPEEGREGGGWEGEDGD